MINRIRNFLSFQNRIFRIEVISTLVFCVLSLLIDLENFDKDSTLSKLIAIAAILFAILIPYIFSKLYSDKTIKISLKKELDEISKKIIGLRKIAHRIEGMYEIWQFEYIDDEKNRKVDVGSLFRGKYKNITYYHFRGEVDNEFQIPYKELVKIYKEVGEIAGQGILAVKGLVGNESTFQHYKRFNPLNFSLDQIGDYYNYCTSLTYFFERYSNKIDNFSNINYHSLVQFDNLFREECGYLINTENRVESITNYINDFTELHFERHSYLNRLFENISLKRYGLLFSNLRAISIVLVLSFLLSIISFEKNLDIVFINLLSAIFVALVVDLIDVIYKGVIVELDIKEVFNP